VAPSSNNSVLARRRKYPNSATVHETRIMNARTATALTATVPFLASLTACTPKAHTLPKEYPMRSASTTPMLSSERLARVQHLDHAETSQG
jgi:hypothetical protein